MEPAPKAGSNTDAPGSATAPTGGGSSALWISGTYRLLELLGAGSSGEVYEAEHVRLGKRVALKILRREAIAKPNIVRRFDREAGALARLTSDFVVTVFDCGTTSDGRPYLVMERLVGEDLKALLAREGKLDLRRVARIATDVCRGLVDLHAAGLVHRDIKPANLFVIGRDGRREVCKILDLGVAKSAMSDSTSQGALLGTVRYMAPEQLADGASVSGAADVYALGAVLYECLSGGPLQDAPTVQELMFRILNQAPAPVSTKRPDVPRRLENIVMRAVERDVTRRFRSAKDLLMELEGLFEDSANSDRAATTAADEPGPGIILAPRDRRKGKRSRALLLVGAAGGLASFAWLGLAPSSSMGPALATRSEPTFAASIGASSTASNDAAAFEPAVTEMASVAPPEPSDSAPPPVGPDAATRPSVKVRPPQPAARQAPRPDANEFVPAFEDTNPYSK